MQEPTTEPVEEMTMKKAATMLQQHFTESASDFEARSEARILAGEMGGTIWMSHTTPEEVEDVYGQFTDESLKHSFLRALRVVVNAPNNQDSIIARDLRPWVAQQLHVLRAA